MCGAAKCVFAKVPLSPFPPPSCFHLWFSIARPREKRVRQQVFLTPAGTAFCFLAERALAEVEQVGTVHPVYCLGGLQLGLSIQTESVVEREEPGTEKENV